MVLVLGPLHIDEVHQRASLRGEHLDLRPLDLRLLAHLARCAGRVMSRAALAESLWGPEPAVDVRAVDTCVTRIRKALDGRGDAIVTVRRVGYRLDPDRLAS